ncbi:nucleotide exchange factor GrpE [Streptomyces sp. NPDC052236]|uniref:nucleotide exchange factor GrpE n=1 Tax=Streptomyces sp. NPDC052236 TaxID=3365686 RepID=UPI0037D4A4B0
MSASKKPTPKDREERPSLSVHDKRRIDPVTLELRRGSSEERKPEEKKPGEKKEEKAGAAMLTGGAGPANLAGPGTDAGAPPPQVQQLRDRVAELTADLQRLKAEYDNYRKRVHRDRLAVREIAVANVLAGLLPVLDAVAQAREHGEVTGGLTAIVDALERQLAALGLQPVGEPGEPFDPMTHEAVTYTQYTQDNDATQPICTEVLRSGYRVGDQLLRPAQVSVSGPPAAAAHASAPTRPAP